MDGALLVMPVAFFCEFVDSSLGMGYGTILTPVLLLMGYEPLQVVPAVLLSEFVTGITSAFFHHSARNVNFRPHTMDFRVALVLAIFGMVGTIASVFCAIKLPPEFLKLWIGFIVLSMGIVILATYHRKPKFRWSKLITLGTVASFNKGISGGGYGPLVMGGQILSGIGVKNAVGITSLTEGLTCLAAIILYVMFRSEVDWVLAPWLMAGAVLSIPFATHVLKKISEDKAKIGVAVIIVILGVVTLSKVFLNQ